MAKRKSWREKLADSKDLPKVLAITGRMTARWGSGTVAIPAPIEVDAIMQRVPRGKVITINEIRARVAAKHGATVVCLLPARTDAGWFHDYVLPHAEVRFIRGRLKFNGIDNSAPFPSAVVIFRPPQSEAS